LKPPITVIHPSRSRPDYALDTALLWMLNAAERYEYILSIDESDPYLEEYKSIFPKGTYVVNNNSNAVQAANAGAEKAKGEILVLISDDFDCPKNWDLTIREALNGKSGLLKTYDGVQKWIVTLPIYTRDYYEQQGYVYPPQYVHLFPDTHITHVADLAGKLIIRNDIVFNHDHHSKHQGPKDDVTKKADSTWAQGEHEYLKACRAWSGLGKVDIFNLSKEAKEAGHIQWLKKKLK
jgi:glycosyltransferase involved in cell wall biosynthesis